MTTVTNRHLTVLVGPTCPTCEADDLRLGEPHGSLSRRHCTDCGTEYRRYELPADSGEYHEVACPGCCVPHCSEDSEPSYCDDCRPSDCAYCGATTLRSMLSRNHACHMCEQGEAA